MDSESKGRGSRPERWLVIALALLFAALLLYVFLSLFHQQRQVRVGWKRDPETFQTVAEYLCATLPERYPNLVYRGSVEEYIQENSVPEDVASALHEVFRRTDCSSIYASRTAEGKPYCDFHDRVAWGADRETGIVYGTAVERIFYLPLMELEPLAEQWSWYATVSYDVYEKSPG